jgi:hypothetical protein
VVDHVGTIHQRQVIVFQPLCNTLQGADTDVL